ncbi:GGDEF domain-containing protein [Thaumasiovibrio sp. DFM-14]|uniref:GGDEF domain-containing protein n=1 Tax=Thaumasiovibrio sp. DFM-14 TaxID=3384792 RepID=UPI0039A0AAE3
MSLITGFFSALCHKLNQNQGLKSLCDALWSQLVSDFDVQQLTLIISYQSQWKVLMTASKGEYCYHSPPIATYDRMPHPFYQISQSIRDNVPNIEWQGSLQRVWLPLQRKSRPLGCLVIDVAAQVHFSHDDLTVLTSLLAAEIEGRILNETAQSDYSSLRDKESQLFNSQREQKALLDRMQALHALSSTFSQTRTMNELLYTSVEHGKKMLGIDRMGVLLYDHRGGVVKGSYGTDIYGETIDESYFSSPLSSHPLAQQTLKDKQFLLFQEDTELYQDMTVVGRGWNGYVALWDDKTLLGWIAVDNLVSGAPLRSYHKHILKQFGATLSQHIIRRQAEDALITLNQQLEQRVQKRTYQLEEANRLLEKLSQEDPLTGIANRRVFDTALDNEWRRAERHQLPLSLLIIDIDHFKQYNDKFGHQQGDSCLHKIATTLNACERRAGALFSRLGGEEFAYLLPGFDQQAAQYTANRLVAAIEALSLPHPNKGKVVTISVGSATITPQLGQQPHTLYEQADKALYQAKSSGRNCACDVLLI